nr:hypothetical protein CFP56_53361 [Quercus suber]
MFLTGLFGPDNGPQALLYLLRTSNNKQWLADRFFLPSPTDSRKCVSEQVRSEVHVQRHRAANSITIDTGQSGMKLFCRCAEAKSITVQACGRWAVQQDSSEQSGMQGRHQPELEAYS